MPFHKRLILLDFLVRPLTAREKNLNSKGGRERERTDAGKEESRDDVR